MRGEFVHLAYVFEHTTEGIYVMDFALESRDLPHALRAAESLTERAGERLLCTRQPEQAPVVGSKTSHQLGRCVLGQIRGKLFGKTTEYISRLDFMPEGGMHLVHEHACTRHLTARQL